MNILDGKEFAKKTRIRIKKYVNSYIEEGRRVPGLAVVIVGNDPASETYVRSKEKQANKVNFLSRKIEFEESVSEEKLIETVEKLNNDKEIDGILVQLPLPSHIDAKKIIGTIKPEKDVDGFHYMNLGKLFGGERGFVSCTPLGIIDMLKYYGIELSGKNVTVIGRSNIVGKPLIPLFLDENSTVTVCHSRTKEISLHTKNADIIVAAVGRPLFLKEDMVSAGTVIVDVGINSIDDDSEKGYHLVGDVDFDKIKDKASWITPVPGGVGPVTISTLLKNTLKAYCEIEGIDFKFSYNS